MNSKLAISLLAIGCVVLILTMYSRTRRGAKAHERKKPSSGGLTWAVLFLSSGRMPPPPPQSQIEAETGERKNRGTGRDADT
jgi:hypothetical protein